MKQLALGILAHVDAGKTTLSEAILYASGEIRRLGRVDHGDAHLDTHALERERGITIFSKQASFRLPGAAVTLLDTPGHADLAPEAERVLSVLDYALLVISGPEGVQSHTRTLWELLERYAVPTFVFVNKMDLAGADRAAVLRALRSELSAGCVDMEQPDREALWDDLSLCSDRLTEEILEGDGPSDDAVAEAVLGRKLFPCWFGSALRNEGVDALLKGLDAYTRMPEAKPGFGARVFKITRDGEQRLTWIKVTSGELKVKDTVVGRGEDGAPWEEKIDRILVCSGAKARTVESAAQGAVCAVTGLTRAKPGDGLGAEADEAGAPPVLEPVLSYGAELPRGADPYRALACFRALEEEEPLLRVFWEERTQRIRVQLMGEVQREILERLLHDRFGLDVTFTPGSVLYRETILDTVEGVGHYEPLRHYAEVHLLMEPLPAGSGLVFRSDCSTDRLALNWQRLVLTHLAEKVHRGVLTGSPVTDIRITLKSGRAHIKHTEGGDFRQATYRAVRQGLRRAKSRLLEPWYRFTLEVPSGQVGRAMTDLDRLGATFDPPETAGAMTALKGEAPVASMREYHAEVVGYTRGEGRLLCVPCGYRPCHNEEEVIRAAGYDCDADVENSADSVFCSHGSGELVRWDEVPARMHLESCFPAARGGDAAPASMAGAPGGAARGIRLSREEDRELERIFERTYGPARKDGALWARPKDAEPDARGVDVPEREEETEYLLVDGYNVIFAWEELAREAKKDLDSARNRLTEVLINYQGYRRCVLILVFDAYKVRNNPGVVEKRGGIDIVYTAEAETADSYIEKAAYRLAKEHRVRVATSDGLEQLIILGGGAIRVSAREFHDEVLEAEKRIRDLLRRESPSARVGEGPLSAALAAMRAELGE